ncbi:Lipid A biosynthesis lauroyl acyltransferase [Serratia fonticola]|uniref:Lipid A biosynthesis lauroyl acyltransferase n=1 Tax=Serratia fonticola TaxID=47917 RepID=A0A4U9VV64_SERFO|nr:Lipid A biosynthesis lauroyl acyltransferase [Serratia fonticola]
MAWFWPNWRIERWFSVSGLEHIQKARDNHQGVLLIGLHFLTLELGARIFGIHNPGIGVYRPHDNKLMDWLQTWGRMRSNKSMLDRKDVKGMIRALKQGEIIWYAPDHDYGPRSSVFCPAICRRKSSDHHRQLCVDPHGETGDHSLYAAPPARRQRVRTHHAASGGKFPAG